MVVVGARGIAIVNIKYDIYTIVKRKNKQKK